MIEIKTKLRKWGNSLGIVISQGAVEREKIKLGEQVKVFLLKDENVLRETFGTWKFKKSAQQMMDEIDKELYNE